MKHLLLLVAVAMVIVSCGKKHDGYTVNGKIDGLKNVEVLLQKRTAGEFVAIDTAQTDSTGAFVFEGKIAMPEMVYITSAGTQNVARFFIENSEITITGHIDSMMVAKVKGSASQDNFDKYLTDSKVFETKSEELYGSWMQAKSQEDTVAMAKVEAEYEKLTGERNDFTKKFINENPKSVVSAYLIASSLIYESSLEDLTKFSATLDTSLNQSEYVKILHEKIEVLTKTAPGKPIIDFALNTPEGTALALSSLKGKYVLVDFWASWCGPCRKENPNVVKLYNLYKDKGFEILGVSFDENREAWLKAIEDDKLTWKHVSDLKGWGCEAGKLYGINSIPHTMLVDPQGVIIEHNLRGEALAAKLAELFAK